MKKIKTYPFMLTILLNNCIFALENSCAAEILQKLFRNEPAINFISENFENAPLQINVPLILANLNNPIALSSHFYTSYVIYTDGYNLEETLTKIKNSPIWNKSQSPRGKFLIVTPSTDLKNTFDVLWGSDIINAIVIGGNGSKIYTSDPFEKENNCGNQAKITYAQNCETTPTVTFNKTVKDVNGCYLKLSNVLTTTSFKESPPVGLLWEMFALMSEILNSHNLGGSEMENEEAAHQIPSEGILFKFLVNREEKDLAKYDFSNIFYYDKLVWAVPTPNKIFGVRILFIYTKTVWLVIIATFLLQVFAWWLIAKNDLTNFRDFARCLLANYAFLLSQSDNLTPNTRSLNILLLFFMVYCIVISVSSQANLMSGLTNPSYEHGITTLGELLDSNIHLVSTPHGRDLTIQRVKIKKDYPKLDRKITVPKRLNQTDNLANLVKFRNVSTLLGQRSIKVCSPANSAVNSIDPELLVMEVFLAMRKGHYFMPTLNKLLKLLDEHGFTEKIMRDANMQSHFIDDNSVYPLIMNHLREPFICLCVGLFIASLAFIIELVRNKETV